MRQSATRQQIRQCRFLLSATSGTATIKFSCSFFLEVKTGNSKHVISSRNSCKLVEGRLPFNEELQLVTNMIHDCKNQRYAKKEAIVTVNLISNSRPNEAKMVGRVVFDLGKAANRTEYQQIKEYPLQYCSVNGSLAFKVVLQEAIPTNRLISDLERSELSQFESISINTTTKTETPKPKKTDLSVILLNRVNLNEENAKSTDDSFQKQLTRIKTDVGLLRKADLHESSREASVKHQTDIPLKQNREQRSNQQNTVGGRPVKAKIDENSYILIRDSHEIDSNRCGSDEKTKREITHNKLYESVNEGTVPREAVVSINQNRFPPSAIPNNNSSSIKRQERQASTRRVTLLLQENRQQQSKLQQCGREIAKQQEQIERLNIVAKGKEEQLSQMSTFLQQQKERWTVSLNTKNEQLRKMSNSANMKEQRQIERLSTALKTKEEELRQISSVVKNQQQMESLYLAMHSKNEELTRTVHNLSVEISSIKKELAERQSEIDEYVERIEKLQHFQVQILEIAEVKQQNRSLIDQNQFVKKDLEQKLARIFQLQQCLEDAKMQKEEISQRCAGERDEAVSKASAESAALLQQLQAQIKHHQTTNLELKQVRQWYNGMQEETSKLQAENGHLKQELQLQQTKESDYQLIIEQLEERLTTHSQKQTDYIKRQQEYEQRQEEIARLQNELVLRKEQAASYIEKEGRDRNNETKRIVLLRKENDQLQLRFQNQNDQLSLSRRKVLQLQAAIKELQKKATETATVLRKREDEMHTAQEKNTDLVRRLKEKEEAIAKLVRTAEESEFKARQLQFSLEQYKKRLKTLEDEKNEAIKHTRTAQRQSRQLKSKMQRDSDSINKQISAYKSLIHTIQNERTHLTNQLDHRHRKQSTEADHQKHVLETLVKSKAETKKAMHENLNVLEYESNRIADILRKKEQYQLQLTQAMSVMYSENDTLKKNLLRVQDQCRVYRQRNEGLAAEIELLNSYPTMNGGQLSQFSRKLMEGNRELSRVIDEKSNEIIERTRSESQLRNLVEKYQSWHGLADRDKLQMEEGLRAARESNDALRQQLSRLKDQFQGEFAANRVTKEQRVQQLQTKIAELQMELSQKQKKTEQTEMQNKEMKQTIYNLREKDSRLLQGNDQSNLLNQQISRLKTECAQKQLAIGQLNAKTKQLQNNIEVMTSQIKAFSGQKQLKKSIIYDIPDTDTAGEQNMLNMHSLQTKLTQLQQRYTSQQKQLANLRKQLSQLHQTSEEELGHISYLQSQLKSCRERESDYITQIDQLQERLLKSRELIGHQTTTSESMQSIEKHEFKRHHQTSVGQSQKTFNKIPVQTGKTYLQLSRFNNQLQQHHSLTGDLKATCEPFPCVLSQHNLRHVMDQLTSLVCQRKEEEDVERTLQLLIESNAKQEEEYEKWSRDRAYIQQKAKTASRELQKTKVNIMRMPGRSILQKTQITALLKPTEDIVQELIHLSQNLAELDLSQQQYEYDRSTSSKERA